MEECAVHSSPEGFSLEDETLTATLVVHFIFPLEIQVWIGACSGSGPWQEEGRLKILPLTMVHDPAATGPERKLPLDRIWSVPSGTNCSQIGGMIWIWTVVVERVPSALIGY